MITYPFEAVGDPAFHMRAKQGPFCLKMVHDGDVRE
jgi:hypothetical protein